MATGDLRGRFDVAYSLENGFGIEKDPETWRQPAVFDDGSPVHPSRSRKDRAYELYQEILTAQAAQGVKGRRFEESSARVFNALSC